LIALDPKMTRVEVHQETESFRVVLRLPAEESAPPAPAALPVPAAARMGSDDDEE
jgi:hypothetical protein